jgi:transcription elongation factor Elf1
MFHHAKGALPLFKRWIEEQKLLLNQLSSGGGDTQIVSDVNKLEKELECEKCNVPISNFFIVPSKKKYTCLMCGKQRQKGRHREPIQVHYRLFDIATAERIVDKVSNKVNDNNNTVVKVTLISNHPKPDDMEIIGEFSH